MINVTPWAHSHCVFHHKRKIFNGFFERIFDVFNLLRSLNRQSEKEEWLSKGDRPIQYTRCRRISPNSMFVFCVAFNLWRQVLLDWKKVIYSFNAPFKWANASQEHWTIILFKKPAIHNVRIYLNPSRYRDKILSEVEGCSGSSHGFLAFGFLFTKSIIDRLRLSCPKMTFFKTEQEKKEHV